MTIIQAAAVILTLGLPALTMSVFAIQRCLQKEKPQSVKTQQDLHYENILGEIRECRDTKQMPNIAILIQNFEIKYGQDAWFDVEALMYHLKKREDVLNRKPFPEFSKNYN